MKYITLFAAMVLIAASSVQAQGVEFGFAGYAGYNTTTDNAMVGVGLDVEGFGQVGPVIGGAWFDIETQFEENVTVVQIDANLTPKYDVGDLELTVGVGIAYEHFSVSDTDVSGSNTGLNLLAGVEYEIGGINPFVRYRCSRIDENSQRTIFGGVILPF
ncbi:MAG: outer membrane beta-barrel protein [Rubricoccaceae bacterium]|nr:outer membrane beta-barrel protein [Rubricoccaceae bacterium]